jgi:hypothetical protein
MVANQILRIPQNGIWQVTFSVLLNNQAVDITGWTAEMQIRPTKPSSTILAAYSTTSGQYMTIDGPSGNVQLDVPATQTLGYTFGRAVYDTYAIDTSGRRFRLSEGSVIVDETVTR